MTTTVTNQIDFAQTVVLSKTANFFCRITPCRYKLSADARMSETQKSG